MHFLLVFVNIVDRSCVLLQGQIVIVVQGHPFLVEFAVAIHQSFHYLQFQIRRGKAIVMLLIDMNHELASKSTDCHGNDVIVRNLPLYSGKQTKKSVIGQDIVKIAVGEE